MKHTILNLISTACIVAGTLVILFAAGGSDAGDFTMSRAMVQAGVGLAIILAGMTSKVLSRKEGN